MDAPDGIPVIEGGGPGLVWLVNGAELPFVERTEPHRPWLEESTGWASSEAPGPAEDAPQEGGDTLLWL